MIIGITGKKRSGKDTLANIMLRGATEYTYSFAKPIKDIAKILGFTERHVNGSEEDKETVDPSTGWDETPRQFLQWLGTDVFRAKDSEVWIKCAKRYVEKMVETSGVCVIPDVRFDNEADAIKGMGGIIIQVVSDRCADSDGHSSEAGIDHKFVDITLNNNGTLEEFEQLVKGLNICPIPTGAPEVIVSPSEAVKDDTLVSTPKTEQTPVESNCGAPVSDEWVSDLPCESCINLDAMGFCGNEITCDPETYSCFEKR